MTNNLSLICATIALGRTPLAQAEEKLPDFVSKVQLHEPTAREQVS